MTKKTPPMGEVSRKMPGSYTRDDHSPIALQAQFLIHRFHLAPAVASAMSAAVFGEAF